MVRRGGPLMMALLMLSCASPRAAPVAPPTQGTQSTSPVSRFFPLADGRIWAFDQTDEENGSTGVFVTRARQLTPVRFSLATGNRTRSVELRADGIVAAETGVYLLKAPLAAGAEWAGDRGGVVRVSSLDKAVQVPAGSFVGCVETVEELAAAAGSANPLRRITTQFCPDVGIASLHVEVWDQGRHLSERASLRSFGEPVTLMK
jgi:hypothetical protein